MRLSVVSGRIFIKEERRMKQQQPQWLNTLLDLFIKSVEWASIQAPVHQIFTYRARCSDNIWEIVISPFLHEIYGGKEDGDVKSPMYEVDILPLADEFDSLIYIGFDSDRGEVSIEGLIDQSQVTLILCQTPRNSKVRKKINTFTGEITRIKNH